MEQISKLWQNRHKMPLMKFSARFLWSLLFIGILAGWAQAQQRPLLTEDVDIIEPGAVRTSIGFEFLQHQTYNLSGLEGDLSRIGVVGVAFGLAPNVEVEVDGVIHQFLNIDKFGPSNIPLQVAPGATSTSDVGDFTLATKIKIHKESANFPSLGFKFGLDLPNTNQAKGLGTNSTNVFAEVLVGKRFFSDRLNLFGNLGVAILTAPTQLFSQNDVAIYGMAGIFKVNNRFNLVGEVSGRHSTRSAPVGTEDFSEARFGAQINAGGLRFDLAGTKGLTKFSPHSGVIFGFTKDIKVFTPIQ